jgi:hypothetical protein
MDGRIFIRAIFDNFISFGDHLSYLRELLLPIGVLSMGFDFILDGSLEGICIHISILAIGERVVIEGTARIGVGLGLDDFAPDVFELAFEGEFVFGLFL